MTMDVHHHLAQTASAPHGQAKQGTASKQELPRITCRTTPTRNYYSTGYSSCTRLSPRLLLASSTVNEFAICGSGRRLLRTAGVL